MPDTIVTIDSVTKLYGNTVAVNNLSLEITAGEILGLIGQNGAGKTTTLKMIVGLLKPTSGTIRVMGENIVRNAKSAHSNIGYLPEDSPLYESMSVRRYLNFFAELNNMDKKQAGERIDYLLDSLDLAAGDKLTGELSKGMKRKVAISRTLLHDPSLLVLDEPNSGLDPVTSSFINDYLKDLRSRGKTIIISAHNLFQIESICDRVAIINNGELYACDTIDSVVDRLRNREYEVLFKAEAGLPYEKIDGNYVFRTEEIEKLAEILEDISRNNWSLTDISVQKPQLEEVYVSLMKHLKTQ